MSRQHPDQASTNLPAPHHQTAHPNPNPTPPSSPPPVSPLYFIILQPSPITPLPLPTHTQRRHPHHTKRHSCQFEPCPLHFCFAVLHALLCSRLELLAAAPQHVCCNERGKEVDERGRWRHANASGRQACGPAGARSRAPPAPCRRRLPRSRRPTITLHTAVGKLLPHVWGAQRVPAVIMKVGIR